MFNLIDYYLDSQITKQHIKANEYIKFIIIFQNPRMQTSRNTQMYSLIDYCLDSQITKHCIKANEYIK